MNRELVSCVFFPTTLVFVDDDPKFLSYMGYKFGRNWHYLSYNDPLEALKFLTQTYKANPFTNRCMHEQEDQQADKRNMEIDIRMIRNEVYNPQRFEEIAVVILDFAMPDINGGELARRLKEYPFKIILLTGEADAQVAVSLFNQGVIHSYIRKDDPHFDVLLQAAIKNLQQEYFQDSSTFVMNSLIQSPDQPRYWFKDSTFKGLLEQLCNANDIVEYYLLDELGSYLLLNSKGEESWLAVADEEMMQTYFLLANDDKASASIVENLQTKNMLPFFLTADDFTVRPADWQNYLHPAQTIKGKEIYYYSYIAATKKYELDVNKIVSYDQFLEEKD